MKQARRSRIGIVVVVAWCVLLGAGCGSVGTTSLWPRRFYDEQTVPGESRVVYQAARAALESMGFNYERGSGGTGRLEMAARIQPGGTAQPLRQRTVIVQVSAGSTQSTVEIGFWEISEDFQESERSVAGGRLLRGGSVYDAFWQHLLEELDKAGVKSLDGPAAVPAGS